MIGANAYAVRRQIVRHIREAAGRIMGEVMRAPGLYDIKTAFMDGKTMTSASKFGRPPTYPFGSMAVGESADIDAPTPGDVKRIAKNASQYGQRHDRFYRCRTDQKTRVTTVTRVR